MDKLIMMVFALLITAQAWSAIPTKMNFQGRITKSDGSSITDGTYGVTLTLYMQPEGNSLAGWSEVQNLEIKNGYFNTELGKVTPLSALDFSAPYYLGIFVAGDAAELTPRQPLNSTPYAFHTRMVSDGSITSAKIANGTITGADIANATITGANIANGAINTQEKAPWAPIINSAISMPKIFTGTHASDTNGNADVPFPSAFSSPPCVTCTVYATGETIQHQVNISSITASGFHANTWAESFGTYAHAGPVTFNWIAIGR